MTGAHDDLLTDGVVVLRCLVPSDAEEQLAGEDPDWIRWFSGGPGSLDGVTKWIMQNQEEWNNDGSRLNWSVRLATADVIVGNVEVNLRPSWLDEGDVNISYGVFAAYRGQGFAARAVTLACEWVRSTRPEAVYAVIQVDPENRHSLRIPQVLGFADDGLTTDEHGTKMVKFKLNLRN